MGSEMCIRDRECTNYLPNRVWDTAPTQSVGNNSERKATTAYVLQHLNSIGGAWTSVATFNTTGTTLGETTAIPAGATEIRVSLFELKNSTAATTLTAQLLAADTATYSNTTYGGCSGVDNAAEVDWTDGVTLDELVGAASQDNYGYLRLIKMSANNTWLVYGRHGTETGTDYMYRIVGRMVLAGEMDRLKIIAKSGTGSFTGTAYVEAYVP